MNVRKIFLLLVGIVILAFPSLVAADVLEKIPDMAPSSGVYAEEGIALDQAPQFLPKLPHPGLALRPVLVSLAVVAILAVGKRTIN